MTTAKTVLIADDTAFVRERFKTAIEGAGHRALTVKSAAELLARVRTDLAQLDLIVLDPFAPCLRHRAGAQHPQDGRRPASDSRLQRHGGERRRSTATGGLGVAGYVNEYSAVQHILPSLAPPLFPDNFNRRCSPRVVLGIPIAYRFGNTIAAALTLNLSRGGIAIRTSSPLACEAKARLRFRLPGSKRDIEAEAKVSWSNPKVGMGLEFERVGEVDQSEIDGFVDAHFFRPR